MSIGPPSYGPWQNWFAWRPVRTSWHGWRWLERIQRRAWIGNAPYSIEGWEYRPTPNGDTP